MCLEVCWLAREREKLDWGKDFEFEVGIWSQWNYFSQNMCLSLLSVCEVKRQWPLESIKFFKVYSRSNVC